MTRVSRRGSFAFRFCVGRHGSTEYSGHETGRFDPVVIPSDRRRRPVLRPQVTIVGSFAGPHFDQLRRASELDRSYDDAPLHTSVERVRRKIQRHMAAVAINYFAYNFIKIHTTLRPRWSQSSRRGFLT